MRKIQNDDSRLAKDITHYLDRGELVPDELTNKLIAVRLEKPDCKAGFILDGYPRNKNQAEFLSKTSQITILLVINLSDEEGVKRLSDRLMCDNGHSYHLHFAPPQKNGFCDVDGLPLFRRSDETAQAIKQRLSIYHQETEPLIDYYRRQPAVQIIDIDGNPPIPQVYQEIEKKLVIHDKAS